MTAGRAQRLRMIGTFIPLLFRLSRGEPAGDFELAAHHGRITRIDGKAHAFENDKRFGLLNIIKKMDERIPMAFRLQRRPHTLMVGRGLAGSNLRIFDEDGVLGRDRPELLLKQRGSFTGPFEDRLVLLHPLLPLRPKVAFL